MKKAYDILRRAKKVTDSKKNDITIASLAEMSGINDATLRRLLKPGVKHKTLDMIARLEKGVCVFDKPICLNS